MMMGAGEARGTVLSSHYAHCESLVRAHDHDRWLATLFAPADKRPHLHALYAFNLEIARIRDVVSDPMPGEIRLQWWTDALDDTARSDVQAHPVAAVFLETVSQCALRRADFASLIDARRADLYDDPMPDLPALIAYCDATASCLFRAAARILAGQGADEAAHYAGVAYGLTGLLRALPLHAARGQCFVPVTLLEKHGSSMADVLAGRDNPELRAAVRELRDIAQDHVRKIGGESAAGLPAFVRPAFLPLAVLPLYLHRMQKSTYDPFTAIEVPLWQRQWRVWRASRA
jgi:15-cis-phytoene synthase